MLGYQPRLRCTVSGESEEVRGNVWLSDRERERAQGIKKKRKKV